MSKNPLVNAAMKRQNLTAKNQLAVALDVDRQLVSKWENRSMPDCINTLKLLAMSGMTADEMLKEIEKQKGFAGVGLLLVLSLVSVSVIFYPNLISELLNVAITSIHYAKS